ncbi:MAG: hypothetical protein ACI4AL_04820 [Aristaeellaceae bacterium]
MMNRSIKGLLWVCAIILLLFLAVETVGGYLSLMQVQQLQQELAQLRIQTEQLNDSLDDIAALCASVSDTQQRIQELFEGENPLEKLLPG